MNYSSCLAISSSESLATSNALHLAYVQSCRFFFYFTDDRAKNFNASCAKRDDVVKSKRILESFGVLDNMFCANIVLILLVFVKCCMENVSPSQARALGEVHHMRVKAVKYLKDTPKVVKFVSEAQCWLLTFCNAFRIKHVFNF